MSPFGEEENMSTCVLMYQEQLEACNSASDVFQNSMILYRAESISHKCFDNINEYE